MPAQVKSDSEVTEDLKDIKKAAAYTDDPDIWEQRFQLAYDNQKDMFKQWATWYEMMYAIKNYKNIGVWRSKIFVPIMSYKVWTIVAKLLAMRPGFSVKIYDQTYSDEDRARTEKANLKLEHDYDNPEFDESIRDRLFDTLADAVICGTGFATTPWKSGTKKTYNHINDEETGQIDWSQDELVETEYGYNDLDPIDAFDVFGAPGKRNWEQKPWIIIKYAGKTRAELMNSDLYDPEVIEKLTPAERGTDVVTKYKQSRNKFLGQKKSDDQDNLDDTTDTFDLYECREKTADGVHICTFAEIARTGEEPDAEEDGKKSDWFPIRSEKQPYWHGKYDLVPFYIRRKPHQAYGESIFEVTESMANAYNDVFNQFADNLNIAGNGGVLMHSTSTVIYDFFYGPGGEVRYSGDKPSFESPNMPDITIFNTMLNFLEGGISNATVSPYASGTPADANDKTQGTAEGITRMQEAAGELTTFLKSNYMQSLKQVGIRWLSNNRQFLDDDLMLEAHDNGKRRKMRITREDFTPKMVMTIDEASMQPATKEEKLESTKDWMAQIFAIQDRSYVQAGISAPAEGMEPVAPPVDQETGEAVVKPMLLDLERLANWLSEQYGVTEFEQFLANSTGDGEQTNTEVVNAIRKLLDEGELDADTAQLIIDSIEGREAQSATTAAAVPASAPTGGEPEGPIEPINPEA